MLRLFRVRTVIHVISVVSVAAALNLAGPVAPAASAADTGSSLAGTDGTHRWLGTWAASMLPPGSTTISAAGFSNQTVRQRVHVSVGSPQVRFELANTFGDAPLQVADVEVALPATGGAIRPGTSRQVTFAGSETVTIVKGARLISDPVSMAIADDSDLTISIYFQAPTGPATFHRQSRETTYISAAGNHTGDVTASQYPTQVESWFYLDAVQVLVHPRVGAVVALGDSITDGDGSTIDANRRWPNYLARRLLTGRGARRAAVLNAGIGANRLLNDSDLGGPNALARLDRDILAQPGARALIVLEGINDIGFSQFPPSPGVEPRTNVSAQEIIDAYRQIIERAHTHGIQVLGATLIPFKGSFYWDSLAETKREQVNAWIRTSGAFDGVVDFDRAVRNPMAPAVLAPPYDSGDHLHPNDAGYQAMGKAIDLNCLNLPGSQKIPTSCTRASESNRT